MAEPHGGGGTGLLAFIAVLFAGFLFAGVAFALFLSTPQQTPTPPLAANGSPTSSLPIFVQPTASPSPPPTPSPLPSFFLTFTPGFTLPIDTALITPIPSTTVPPITPIPTPTIPRTPRPTPIETPTPPPTPPPTPRPTPANCELATGTQQKNVTISSSATSKTVPAGKVWCLTGAGIAPGMNYGNVKFMLGNRVLFQAPCDPGTCDPFYQQPWPPPDTIVVREGKTLSVSFDCDADLVTEGLQDCAGAGVPPGASITFGVEVFAAP